MFIKNTVYSTGIPKFDANRSRSTFFISVCDNIISTLIFPFAKVGARHMRGYPPPGDPGRGGIGAALGTRGSSPLPGQTRQATLPAF